MQKHILKYARISPRKVQIVCDLIRGKRHENGAGHPDADAQGRLGADAQSSLKSAVSNAENNHDSIPTTLRFRNVRKPRPDRQTGSCRAQGRAYRDQQEKRLTITIVVKERE
jgi:large subunit ribosomal protein L22